MRKFLLLSLVFAIPIFILIPTFVIQGLFGVSLIAETASQWPVLGGILFYFHIALMSIFPYSDYRNFLALLSIILFILYFLLAFFLRNNPIGQRTSLGLLVMVYTIMIFVLFSAREGLQLQQQAMDEDWARLKPQASSFVCYEDVKERKRFFLDVRENPWGEGTVDIVKKDAEDTYFGVGTVAQLHGKEIVLYESYTLGRTLSDQVSFLKTCKNAEGKSIPDMYEIDDQFVQPSAKRY